MQKFTNKELLFRIDERQQEIMKKIDKIEDALLGKVTDDDEYKQLKQRVDLMWDRWNRVIGYGAAAGAAAGIALRLVENLIFN